MKSMQQQGASQAQMMDAAMNQLRAAGMNTAQPAVQQAAAQVVAAPQTAGVSPSMMIVAGLGALAVVFALARPSKRQ